MAPDQWAIEPHVRMTQKELISSRWNWKCEENAFGRVNRSSLLNIQVTFIMMPINPINCFSKSMPKLDLRVKILE
jgi:hypothetical protein